MLKALIITYYWPPSGGAGVQRWLQFTKHLAEFGVEPIVLTVDEGSATYPQYDESLLEEVPKSLRVIRTKSFEPLSMYGKLVGKERVPYGGFSNKKSNSSISKFLRGNFFVPDARRGWNNFAKKRAIELLKDESIDLVITTGPPHSTHLIGLHLQKQTGVKWVADLRDPWTDIYYNKELHRLAFAEKYDKKLEKKVLAKADLCITVSNGFRDLFKSKVDRSYHVITNGFEKIAATQKDGGGVFSIAYTGTIAESYNPLALFQALGNLQIDFEFLVAGNIAPKIESEISNATWADRLNYIGYVPHDQLMSRMSNADMLVLIVPEVEKADGIIPGKLFEYLALRKPILAISESLNGDVARILRETRAGVCYSRKDLNGILKFIEEVETGKFTVADSVLLDKYSRKSLTRELSNCLKDLVE